MSDPPFNDAETSAARGGRDDRPLSERAAPRAPNYELSYRKRLNPEQIKAVEMSDGPPVLVLAGAGTGKTRVLTTRLAHLIHDGRAWPGQILAVTFTNKAAREMKDRVRELIGDDPVERMPWFGTFHAVCAKILRRHAELADLKSNFTILDDGDQLRLIKQVLDAEDVDQKRWPPRLFASMLDRWKNRGESPTRIPAKDSRFAEGRGAELYAAYQDRLRDLNAVDFGDLLLHVLTVLQNNEDVLKAYRNRFKHILVDEYQDINIAQYMLLKLLDEERRNIFCVGDDDQSIYGWRGVEISTILDFEKHFKGARIVRLERNYRSTPHILGAASGLIAANRGRLGKDLWTDEDRGEKVRLIGHWDGEEEARWIGEEIEALQRGARGREPVGLDDCAILVRTTFQMRAFEDRFLNIGLPYRVVGGPRFYERREIRDAIAYFRIAVSRDDTLAFERIVNTPKRGIGDKAMQALNHIARSERTPLFEAARRAADGAGDLPGRARKELALLVKNIDGWHGEIADARGSEDGLAADGDAGAFPRDGGRIGHVYLAGRILEESGYVAMWQADKSPDAPGRLENLKELVRFLGEFENLQGFLEHVSLVMDSETGNSGPRVSIMTLHQAKGLEFLAVFLPGWEDGLFPNQRAMDEDGLRGVEEERRLAYVGLTRARRHLTVCFAANRHMYGRWQSALPSRFIDELPGEHVEVLTPPGLYGGHGGGRNAADDDAMEGRAAQASTYNSPGWKRMAARRGGREAAGSPHGARAAVVDAKAAVAFSTGERVFHQKFGYGTVTTVEGDKLTIAFEKTNEKQIVARFVTPAKPAPDAAPPRMR